MTLLHVQLWQLLNCRIMRKTSKEESPSDQQGLWEERAQGTLERGRAPTCLGVRSARLNTEGLRGSLTLHSVKTSVIYRQPALSTGS